MKIEALSTFLDGPRRFEAGDVVTVSDENGARFCAAGWAKDVTGQIATGDGGSNADLDIHSSTLGVQSTIQGA